jgi:hypothetical protein
MVKIDSIKKHMFGDVLRGVFFVDDVFNLSTQIPKQLGDFLKIYLDYYDFNYNNLNIVSGLSTFIHLSLSIGFRSEMSLGSNLSRVYKGSLAGIPVYCNYQTTDENLIKIYNKDKLIIELEWKLRI